MKTIIASFKGIDHLGVALRSTIDYAHDHDVLATVKIDCAHDIVIVYNVPDSAETEMREMLHQGGLQVDND